MCNMCVSLNNNEQTKQLWAAVNELRGSKATLEKKLNQLTAAHDQLSHWAGGKLAKEINPVPASNYQSDTPPNENPSRQMLEKKLAEKNEVIEQQNTAIFKLQKQYNNAAANLKETNYKFSINHKMWLENSKSMYMFEKQAREYKQELDLVCSATDSDIKVRDAVIHERNEVARNLRLSKHVCEQLQREVNEAGKRIRDTEQRVKEITAQSMDYHGKLRLAEREAKLLKEERKHLVERIIDLEKKLHANSRGGGSGKSHSGWSVGHGGYV
jgi:chromosome segregation ATPase